MSRGVVGGRPGGVPAGPPEGRRGVAPHVHHVGALDLHHAGCLLSTPGRLFNSLSPEFFPFTADPRSDWC